MPPEERKTEEKGKKVNPHLKAELEVIKQLPKEERRSRIQELKEKIVEQKLGIAKMQEKFTEIIHRESKMPIKDLGIILETALEQYAKEYSLDDYQKNVSREVIGRFLEKHKAIERVSEAFPDDTEMFTALFGRKPNGKVKIRTTPAMIYVQCFNPYDYAYLATEEFIKSEDLTEEKRQIAAMAYGVAIRGSKLPSVKGLLAAENSSRAGIKYGEDPKRDIFDHEEQHVIKRLFDEEKLHDLEKMGSEMTARQFQERFSENLRNMREDAADRHVKDEILAFFKGGTAKDVIYRQLTENPTYDYLKPLRARYANPSPRIYKKYVPLVEESVEQILVEEYHKMIENGINAVMKLERLGYSKDQIIGLLINEHLVRWQNLAHRISEQEHGGQK